ncbi:uncharacterized protein BKA78DRAFT_170238 [Phyllosticta capitalensis]|uniref:uncharacterized protein n=1 Tax=Phyllosticta capitalensis TaxID=121624 RepID=UPI00312FA9C8
MERDLHTYIHVHAGREEVLKSFKKERWPTLICARLSPFHLSFHLENFPPAPPSSRPHPSPLHNTRPTPRLCVKEATATCPPLAIQTVLSVKSGHGRSAPKQMSSLGPNPPACLLPSALTNRNPLADAGQVQPAIQVMRWAPWSDGRATIIDDGTCCWSWARRGAWPGCSR